MAGLADLLLGKENPFAQFIGDNRNKIRGAFAGLGSAPTFGEGLASASQFAAQAAPLDDEQNAQRAMRNKTSEWLRAQPGGAQFADAIDNGMIDGATAFKTWYDASRGPDPTANMRDWQYAQENPGYAEFLKGSGGGGGGAPSGYQFTPDGQLAPIPGGPADPGNPLNARRTVGGTPPATIAKEIFEADEAIQAAASVIPQLERAMTLNDTAWAGPLANERSAVGALFGNGEAADTQEYRNIVTAQALEQLKAVFGSMPTEGERKILLEVQGSVDQAPEVRRRILERAKAAVTRRLEFNKNKAASLRSGQYFDDGYSPTDGGAPGNQTATGVQWSIEP